LHFIDLNPLEQLKNKHILVTGGAGFIGSNLCETLLEMGNRVYCLDNFLTGKRENISPFLKENNFHLIEGDIRDFETCKKAVSGMDYVFHQAALGSVPRSVENPLPTNDININGFLNILSASKEAKVKRFIYASSSSVYGDLPELPKTEEKTGRPLSPYAVTKQVNEMYAGVFADLYQMEIIGLRYFNVFGKKQDPEGAYAAAIPKFIKLLIHGKSPVIFGNGLQTRDFTHVSNVVEANILAASCQNNAALNQVYNVACGSQITLNELYSILIDVLSPFYKNVAEIKPTYTSERKGDIRDSLASVKKAEKLLGYIPKCNVRTGLEDSISWYVNNLTA
jgi:UDP-N-acetylglucosamine/UDP-N-acetylgalactosamine 4-epimerase